MLFLLRPETHLPTNWSPAFSDVMYRLSTPGIAQFARRQIDAMGGLAVLPVETCVAAPFRIECVPKSDGEMPSDANSSRCSGLLTMLRKIELNRSY